MARVKRLGDRQVHHGVTKELEAFVVAERGVTMLVMPARMDEGLLEQVKVSNRKADPCREGLGWTHDAVVRPTRGLSD